MSIYLAVASQCVGKRRYIYRWRDIAMHKMNTKHCERSFVWFSDALNTKHIYVFYGLRTHKWHSRLKWFEIRMKTRLWNACVKPWDCLAHTYQILIGSINDIFLYFNWCCGCCCWYFSSMLTMIYDFTKVCVRKIRAF